jgi:hypothetical protein
MKAAKTAREAEISFSMRRSGQGLVLLVQHALIIAGTARSS